MGTIADAINNAWRDYVTDNIPATGENEPDKAEIRAIGAVIEQAVANAGLGALVEASFSTLAAANAGGGSLDYDAGTIGLVSADPTAGNNGLIVKSGTSGSGSWAVLVSFVDMIEPLAQPYVDAAAAEAAAAAAAEQAVQELYVLIRSQHAFTPSEAWDGTAGSGFAVVPADPVRTSAKPAMRLIVPPNQYFTSSIWVGVYAGANAGGDLSDNMGLERVTAHYEGTQKDIPAPTVRTFADVNGNPVSYFGWWIELFRDGRNGHANLYFEAVPRDVTMQRRVIGPYQFSPQATLHDYSVVVAPSQPVDAGVSYQTIVAAMIYLRGVSANNPLITIVEAGDYDIASGTGGSTYVGQGWLNVTASVPVTIAKPSLGTDAASVLRTRYVGTRWFGDNITFDAEFVSEWYNDGVRDDWFDGVTIMDSSADTVSDPPTFAFWKKTVRPSRWFCRNSPYFTECDISGINDPLVNANLARGNIVHACYHDIAMGARCSVGNRFSQMNSEFWWEEVPSLTVNYTGAGTATLALSGGNGAGSRTFTAKVDAVTVDTFTVQNSETAFNADTNVTVQNVKDWIDSLADWSATLLDNSYRAAFLSRTGFKGAAFGDTAIGAGLTLVAKVDMHPDLFGNFGSYENMVFADNRGWSIYAQDIFLADGGGARDILVINNALHNRVSVNPDHAQHFSQLAAAHGHVVLAHNSHTGAGLLLRTDTTYNADGYCLLANNVIKTLTWQGSPDADLVIANNHLETGATSPSGSTGTTIGGDDTSLYVDADAGDFTPAGDLLTNLKTRVVKYDRRGVQRAVDDSAGSEAKP